MPTVSDGNANWQTMYQRLVEATRQRDAQNVAHAKLSLIAAIKQYKHKAFYFNRATSYFYLMEGYSVLPRGSWSYDENLDIGVPGTSEPDDGSSQTGPGDILTVSSIQLREKESLALAESTTRWSRPLTQKTRVAFDDVVSHGSAYSSVSPGEPTVFVNYGRHLEFWPVPMTDYIGKLRYVRDLGVPYATYNAADSTWEFFKSDGSALADGDTSPWFNEASELIYARAMWHHFRHYLDDPDRADAARELEIEALGSLTMAEGNRGEHMEREPEYP